MLEIRTPPIEELRKRFSSKWRDCPPDVIPLPVAEMDFEIAQPIRSVLIELLNNSDTGYLGSAPEVAENFANFAKERWGWIPDTEQTFIATDVGVAVVEMARTLVSPGDRALINSPVYHNFSNWIQELRCELVDAPLVKNELHYTLDFDAIESAYASGIKIHLLCNPHNPVGSVFTKSELSRLAELAKQYNVVVFSDEVHGPMEYNEHPFVPFLSVSSTAQEVGICITAASKSWNIAGLKCAIIITASEKLKNAAESMPLPVHYRASLFGAISAATAFTCTEWLDSAVHQLDQNRHYLAKLLSTALPRVGYRIPDFGYLAWLDLTHLQLGNDPAARILDEAKVLLNAGQTFAPNAHQFVRLNFATSELIIEESINRIARLVNNK